MQRLIQAFIDFISPESKIPQIGQVWEYRRTRIDCRNTSTTTLIPLEILWVDAYKVAVLPTYNDLVEYIPLEEFKLKAYRRVK